ncbi:VOC family protein [Nonomuraea sp. NPDC049152]|uniref:VOC family protein n=1 Tax=Nonomuraea sp. NPDC049152 TaxID=3154350 RepID=UPI0033F3693B
MDVMHPRLLVDDFAACYRFYAAVLPSLTGAHLARGDEAGPYASWDVGSEGVLSLFSAAVMAAAVPVGPATGGGALLVSRVDDVDAAYALCVAHGGRPVAPPEDRPAWGQGLRTAHVRDPEGNLLELQSY